MLIFSKQRSGRTQSRVPFLERQRKNGGALVMHFNGARTLTGGSSLPKLLFEYRGVRNRGDLKNLTRDLILAWAESHHQRTKSWPTRKSGSVTDSPDEQWEGIDLALNQGLRGLARGSSLARLLKEERGVRNRAELPPLSEDQILVWADAHHQRTSEWPKVLSGPVFDAPGENWQAIHASLSQGHRGLAGGSSLAQLLTEKRGVRNPNNLPPLTVNRILAWMDTYHERTGDWPSANSGTIESNPDETWSGLNYALGGGRRGLPKNSSLAKLLEEYRGVPHRSNQAPLTIAQILAWADAHQQQTGRWPTKKSCQVIDVPREKWSGIDASLNQGHRCLPGGSSLARLIKKHRAGRATE
jgi:hypothetical protein